MSKYTLIHNNEQEQYEFHIEGFVAVLNYKCEYDGMLGITHVGVPSELGGRGVGSQLVEAVLVDIERRGFRIRAICPFVVTHIARHTEWERLLANNV